MITETVLVYALYLAGAGQLFIALVYDWVREILGWDADIERMENIWNRQIAHTYSRYIQGVNAAFGLITLAFAAAFFEGNAIATALALMIGVYWAMRMVIALGFYRTDEITRRRPLYRIGAWGFNLLFGYLAVVYLLVFALAVAKTHCV